METIAPETQFSIYKIDFERVERVLEIKVGADNPEYVQYVAKAIITSSIKLVKRKHEPTYRIVSYMGFNGIIFKTTHFPIWKDIAVQILQSSSFDGDLAIDSSQTAELTKNVNVSYILLYAFNGKLYALTGGFGSSYITKFADKNFGLYLIPKVVREDTPVLKQILQNRLSGNQLSSQHSNRVVTNFSIEKEMSSIFRELSLEVDREIARAFGVYPKPGEPERKVSILNKDSIVIRKSFSIPEIKIVIEKIDELSTYEDNFALNYIVLAKKRNLKNADLFDALVEVFQTGNLDNFVLVGDEYSHYIVKGSQYSVFVDEEENVPFLVRDEPITLLDVFSAFRSQSIPLTKHFISTFLKKWSIGSFDDAGNIVLPRTPIIEAIQGYIEFGAHREPVYIFNGEWYVFDEKYAHILQRDFTRFFDRFLSQGDQIIDQFQLQIQAATEEQYNKSLAQQIRVILSHKVLLMKIELCDAIFFDENYLYLLHNKIEFSGGGARDLTNQILTSAEYIQKIRLTSEGRTTFSDYYDSIAARLRKKYGRDLSSIIDRESFVEKFMTANICYIAGYLRNYRRNSQSTYAKYLTIETAKKIKAKGYEFLTIALSD